MTIGADRGRPSRRQFLVRVANAFAGAAVWLSVPLGANEALPHLTLNDPTAVALHYTDDASRIDPTKDPTHLAGTMCANCRLYQGGNATYGPCQLFPGKLVSSRGWCMGYQKKGKKQR